jgi:hypothetical protein
MAILARSVATHPMEGVAASTSSSVGSDHYAKYLSALRAVEIRFPVSNDSSHVNVAFKWHDSFIDSVSCTQKNIHFEKAGVIFSMGALESQRGAEVSRDTQAGIAEAAKAFALSAGAAQLLAPTGCIDSVVCIHHIGLVHPAMLGCASVSCHI